jgi:hypothetical protein
MSSISFKNLSTILQFTFLLIKYNFDRSEYVSLQDLIYSFFSKSKVLLYNYDKK